MKIENKFNSHMIKKIFISNVGVKNIKGEKVPAEKITRPHREVGILIEGRNFSDIENHVKIWAYQKKINLDLIIKVVF
jgi:hypothetical protein